MNRIRIQPPQVEPRVHLTSSSHETTVFSFMAVPTVDNAQSSIDDSINAVVRPVTDAYHESDLLHGPCGRWHGSAVRADLAPGSATIFTVYNRFVNLTAFRHALDVVRGKFDDPNHKGKSVTFKR